MDLNNNATTSNVILDNDTGVLFSTDSNDSFVINTGITAPTLGLNIKLSSRIGPKLYFKYIKSKLRPIELKKLKNRLGVLRKHLDNSVELGQYALQEELTKKLLNVAQESEYAVCGITKFIQKEHIDKFMNRVSISEERQGKIIYFKKLEEFPRPIPEKIGRKISGIKRKKLFDELWVLYLDYTKDSTTIKSTKQKIKEKDPVLFGRNENSNTYYYILEWIDEVCDLSLNEIIDKTNIKPEEIPKDLDKEFVDELKAYAREQQDKLRKTNVGNYKQLMKDEGQKRESFISKLKFWSRK